MTDELKISKNQWAILMSHAEWNKAKVDDAIKLAKKKHNNKGITMQKILNEIWAQTAGEPPC